MTHSACSLVMAIGNVIFGGFDRSEIKRFDGFKKKMHSCLPRQRNPACTSWGQSVQRGRVCACVKLSRSHQGCSDGSIWGIYNSCIPLTSVQVKFYGVQMTSERLLNMSIEVKDLNEKLSPFLRQTASRSHDQTQIFVNGGSAHSWIRHCL